MTKKLALGLLLALGLSATLAACGGGDTTTTPPADAPAESPADPAGSPSP